MIEQDNSEHRFLMAGRKSSMRGLKQNGLRLVLLCDLFIFLLCGCGKPSETEYIFPEMPAKVNDGQEELVSKYP